VVTINYDIYVVGQHCVLCEVKYGEDLSRYSNKIESDALRKCPYCHYLTQKKNISQSLPPSWRENSWHRYGMKKLRHCHPICIKAKDVILCTIFV